MPVKKRLSNSFNGYMPVKKRLSNSFNGYMPVKKRLKGFKFLTFIGSEWVLLALLKE